MENFEEAPLVMLGIFFLAGYVAHVVGSRTKIPRVILLLLVGMAIGPIGLNVVPIEIADWFPIASQIALSVIGFELGEKFLGKTLKALGRGLFIISIVKVIGTAAVVFGVLMIIGTPIELALILAGIAPATAPAATIDVINEVKAKGELTDITIRLVALDDAWTIILFSLLAALAAIVSGSNEIGTLVLIGVKEVLGAIVLGAALGLPMAWVTGRASKGELTLIETLGFVFLCGGMAGVLDLSYILACMSMGCVVSNMARHHTRPFHAIENIHQPFLIVFFLLAGYHADFVYLSSLGVLTIMYIVARIMGGVLSGFAGANLAGFSPRVGNLIGLCLLPQAGVALGLGLLAAERFPNLANQIIAIVVGTSIVFELFGPVFTRFALFRAHEIPLEKINTVK